MASETQSKEYGAPPTYPVPPYYAEPNGQGQSNARNMVDPTSDSNYGNDRNNDRPIIIQPWVMTTTPEPYAVVPDYLVLSIISILFCTCLGIVSIVKASNARSNKAAGLYQTALKDARTALHMGISAIVIGIFLTAIIVAFQVYAVKKRMELYNP